MKEIIFTKVIDVSNIYSPTPSAKNIPEWYKNLDAYSGFGKTIQENGSPKTSAKKCMPLFDSICSGYIIYSNSDIFVSQKTDKYGKISPFYHWKTGPGIDFHSPEQALNHPQNLNNRLDYPKFINPWAIKTPKGYSCLFITPVHRDSIFTIMPGVVDTDKYNYTVNFPFTLNDSSFEGLIPAGTPIAQVIPFKRDNWKMSIGGEKQSIESKNSFNIINSQYFDSYKNMFRQEKQYR
jgi:hypothetical protein